LIFNETLKPVGKETYSMPNNSKPVEETGTYSCYFNDGNLEDLKRIGIDGLPPAKVIDRLCEKARQFKENKEDRQESIKELQREIDELRDQNKP